MSNEQVNMRSLIASTISQKMQEAQQVASGDLQHPAPTPVQQPPAQQPPAQPAPVQTPADTQQPPAPPQPPVVSTDSVDALDIGARFRTPVTDAPAAPTALPPDTPVDAPPEIERNEKAKSAWEILRNRERESRHLAESLQARLEEITKQAGSVADERARFADELKSRDDKIHELEDRLGKAEISASESFRHQYDEKMDAAALSLREALQEAAELDDAALDDTVKKLLAVNDADFNRMVSQLPSAVQGSLWDKRREYRNISTAREKAIAEWRTAQAGVSETEKQRKVIEHTARRRDLAEQAIDFTNTQMKPEDRPAVLAEDTYKADIESANHQFRGFMQVANDDEIARVAYQGFLVPVMQRQVAYLVEALGKWRDAYYAIRGAGAPPALPIRTQQATPATPIAPAVAAPIVDRGGSISNVIQDTITRAVRGSMPR